MTATATERTEPLDRKLIGLGAVVVLGTILSILDSTIVNVATRTLGQEFHTSISTIQWVLTGYLLGFASVIPLSGWASNRFGAKRVWIGALVLFLIGSALAGIAWSIGSLIVFRVLQGVGAGLILPVGQAILAQAAGPARMGRVMSIVGLPMLLSSVAGPIIGGLIVSTVSWRWIFFVNIPIGAVAIALAVLVLPAGGQRAGTRLDLRGLLLISAGVVTFSYGLSEAGMSDAGFGSARALSFLTIGAVLIGLYGVHAAARKGRALVDITLFRQRAFATAAVTNLLIAVALFGMLILVPLYWQIVRGQDALATGLLLMPQALGAAAAMPLAGRMTDRGGARATVLVGLGFAMLGTLAYTQLAADSSVVVLAAALFVIGLGLGASIMPSMAAAYRALPRADVPAATSALNTIQRLGASIGTTVLAVVLQRSIAAEVPGGGGSGLGPLDSADRARVAEGLAHAFGATFWVALALIAIALVPAFLQPRRAAGPAAGH
jgi:EmrB/QacA subfamily drug resistance transporter